MRDHPNFGTNRARRSAELSRDVERAAEAWRLAALGLRASVAIAGGFSVMPGWRWHGRGRPPTLLPIRAFASLKDLDRARRDQPPDEDYRVLRRAQVRDAVAIVAQFVAVGRALEVLRRRTGFPVSQGAAAGLHLLASWRRRRRGLLDKAAVWSIVAREVQLSVGQLRRFARSLNAIP